jgi:hypothetical protein
MMVASFNGAASASPLSSRHSRIHHLRTPSNLGELLWDALRVALAAVVVAALFIGRGVPGEGGKRSGSGGGGGTTRERVTLSE